MTYKLNLAYNMIDQFDYARAIHLKVSYQEHNKNNYFSYVST